MAVVWEDRWPTLQCGRGRSREATRASLTWDEEELAVNFIPFEVITEILEESARKETYSRGGGGRDSKDGRRIRRSPLRPCPLYLDEVEEDLGEIAR